MLRLMLEAHVLDVMYARHKALKDEVAAEFQPGDKSEIKNPQGLKLGSVSMSSPNKKAVCTDEAVLLAQAQDAGMELVDHLPHPDSAEYQQAIDVLLEHAPELLPDPTISREDTAELSKQVLEEWQITGRIPEGWEIKDSSEPRFTVRKGTSKQTKAAVAHLAGKIDGLLELDAPKEDNNA